VDRLALRAAWYRFRATFARRRGAYATIVVLLGLVGGIALGSLAGARETQGSYDTYLASTNPQDLAVFDAFANPQLGFTTGFIPGDAAKIARLPGVQRAYTVVGFDGNVDYVRGLRYQPTVPGAKPPTLEGPYGAEYRSQDTVTVLQGRLFDPSNAHEAVIDAEAAAITGLRVGSEFTVALNSDAQLNAETATSPTPPPARVARVRVVGLVTFSDEVAADQYNQLGSATVLLSPALTRSLATCCATYSTSSLKLSPGDAHLATVERELVHVLGPTITSFGFQTTAPAQALADRALKPIAIALAVFGALALLAALVIVGQVIGRQLRIRAEELNIMRALGADPATIVWDALIGVLGALVMGALIAAVVCVAMSPLFPLGPVHPVYPKTVVVDWTVIGLGFVGLVVVLGAVAGLYAMRMAPHRVQARARRAVEEPSRVAATAASAGLSVPAVTGIRFALDSGRGRDSVPVRSAILGGVLAVLMIIAAVTFGASLNYLVSHPALYGWKWDYTLLSGFSGDEDLPGPQTAALLRHDHDVRAFSGAYFISIDIDGQRDLPTIAMTPGAAVAPPIVQGHALQQSDQIVLGQETLASLHKKIGDTVEVGGGGHEQHRLLIVGTAIMPAISGPGLGVGAILDDHLVPANLLNAQGNTITGPNAFFIQAVGGGSPAALSSLQAINHHLNVAFPADGQPAGGVITVLKPTEIVDSHSIEAIPAVLGAGLAAGAVGALGVTLYASVRRRRRDLAVLKTLGFARRQLATVVAWQASVAVGIGALIGAPLGVVLGRYLWELFADQIDVVPTPIVPLLTVVLVAVGAVAVANIAAAFPGRLAARTSTGWLLRSD
jgi:ABC-type antimicrobial peptide transport system permease subunit